MKKLLLTTVVLGLFSISANAQTTYASGSYFGGPPGSVITCTVQGNVRCCSIGGANVTTRIAPTCRKIQPLTTTQKQAITERERQKRR
jgi:hypothetical protein